MNINRQAAKINAAGFTLIELIIVIVMLGILSVVALPRFVGLSSDANTAKVNSLKAALETGSNLVYSMAIVRGKTVGAHELDIGGDGTDDIRLRNGYPRVASSCEIFVSGMQYWMHLELETACSTSEDGDWSGSVSANQFHLVPNGFALEDECSVTYTTASVFNEITNRWDDTDYANVDAVTTGC